MSYNGWQNYETWAVALWWDNDAGSYEYRCERVQEICADAAPRYDWETLEQARVSMVADWLKEETRDGENAPDLGATLYADLLGAALDEVNWREIAQHWVDDARQALTPGRVREKGAA